MRIGVLWRVEWDPVDGSHGIVETCKLHGMFAAFAELGIAAEPVVYSDDSVDVVRDHLLALDGVLVWVNPIEQGLDRSKLDPLLREVAEDGVWVSAHPDVILKTGTKQVLVDTQGMSWGTHAYVYRSAEELRQELPLRLAAAPGPLVLKQYRGMGGTASGRSKRRTTAGYGCSTLYAMRSRSTSRSTSSWPAARATSSGRDGWSSSPSRTVSMRG